MRKNSKDTIIDGVCSGIARHFDVDPIWIRLIFCMWGLIWLYVILMFIMPEDEV